MIHFHTVLNLTILSLIDADGVHRHISFAPLTALSPPGTTDRTARTLEEITEPQLRARAQQLIDSFYERTATAQANADAFGAALPDLPQLLHRLSSIAPSGPSSLTRASCTFDDDTLTVVLTLTASGPSAGILLALTGRWPRPTDTPADGITHDLDTHGRLTVRFDQRHAEQFLTWYRTQP
ncbi:hypothetical protein OG458_41540 (plasmid) [Streptomyces sp. NBC_01281]|uniref:hypothetical protein n=1 Tax=Streptomyces sp. NBC_01281 TaxID=2903811 RepID=UPI002E15C5AD|nr:hypothetical protein OG458_41540 [Streptomyces sp. NBC_01281]